MRMYGAYLKKIQTGRVKKMVEQAKLEEQQQNEEFSWNDEQLAAIGHKGKGIVVSAAAGSGKTAVLVERIIQRICDEENPVSFDRFLIVTFTRAAAKEMSQRLRKKLDERIAEDPTNAFLLRQKRMLPLANVSSIDSFLLTLVRENAHRLGISPDLRIIDTAQKDLMINESFNETLDIFYDENRPEFRLLVDAVGKKGENDLFAIVSSLNDFADSHVSPDEWLDNIVEFNDSSVNVADTVFGKILLDHITETAEYSLRVLDNGIKCCEDFEGLETIHRQLSDERSIPRKVIELAADKKWDELKSYLETYRKNYSQIKWRSVPEELRSSNEYIQAKTMRDKSKDIIGWVSGLIPATAEQFAEDVKLLEPVVRELIRFIHEYRRIFTEKKNQNESLDFNDVMHLALKLLRNVDGSASDVALEVRKRFDEILIDEYQDTNEAQDAIFKLISDDLKNLFLVGDVKQAIYGFRLASPYMFIEKIKEWKRKDVEYAEYINLDCNYRSRAGVLNCVNYLFEKTMSEKVGDIAYDADEALKPGFKFPTPDANQVEFDIVCRPKNSENITEAQFVAKRIKQILATESVYDKKKKITRPVTLRDICVLCRSNSACAKYATELNDNGVSAYYNAKKGYFKFNEIRTMLSFLEILDNPLQDIPLLCVLASPIFGFSADELAKIRIGKREGRLYYAVRESDDEKCVDFIKRYTQFRRLASVLPVSALIREIYERTGYYTVAGALTNGEFRQMNLMLLIDYAAAYEENSSLGLAGFVRYLERCRDSNTDFEPAAAVNEGADVVRVMTVHKSKGLEFPIVFLVGTGSGANDYDDYSVDESVGIGFKICDKKKYKTYSTVQFTAAKLARGQKEYSEELRLLYVAMTRAMERLIITAQLQNPSKRFASADSVALLGKVDPLEVSGTNNFIDLIIKAFVKHPDCKAIRDAIDFDIKADDNKNFDISFNIINESPDQQDTQQEIADTAEIHPDAETVELIRQRVEYEYPYSALATLVTKKSASSFNDDSLEAGEYFAFDVPQFARDGAMTGAQRGTAMHRFMEVCDFERAKADAAAERDRLVAEKLLTPEQGEVLNIEALAKFFESEVYSRIAKSSKVMREQKFTVFVPASFVNPELGDAAKDEKVLVQGVIDCAFFENGKTVVLDYKTDRVSEAGHLAGLYHRQLEVYKIAAEECFGKDVSELLLYSFALGEEVKL